VKRKLVRAAVVIASISIAAFLFVAAGLVPITASSGHWPITEWFLHFAMKRSVATHSLSVDAPPLDDPALVIKGATHYHGGCLPCHGGPGEDVPVILRGMIPPPPHLGATVAEWDAEELFYIVKHGVKFTGMPAWTAQQRDDEVWAVVAFLRKLQGMDAAAYHKNAIGEDAERAEGTPTSLLAGSATARDALRQSCARCHGVDGLGRGSAFPKLAGQRAEYMRNALDAYARGERHSGIMQPIAAGLEPETLRVLADYYAGLPSAAGSHQDPGAVARGEAIARQGIPGRNVPSCVDCHGPGSTSNAAYPMHAGQTSEYLLLQLQLFQEGHRGGSPHARLMEPIARRLTVEQMRDVAAYYGALPSAPAPSAK
jgi:cytochrome c553